MMHYNKSWIIAVAVSLIFVFCTSYAFSQSIIKVQGIKDSIKIKKQAEMYLDFLGIHENIHLLITFSSQMPEKLKGITLPLQSLDSANYLVFNVKIDAKISQREKMLILAHEMIHIKQYTKNELKLIDKGKMSWKGKIYYYNRAINRKMPWELEAFRFDRTLANLSRITKNKYEETLAEEILSENIEKFQANCVNEYGKCHIKNEGKNPI